MAAHSASGIAVPVRALASNQREATQELLRPGWRTDSTAYLVGSNALHVELPFQLFSVRQLDVQQDDPISRHRKIETSLVPTRTRFLCNRERGTHARVRHICLDRNLRACERFADGIAQLEIDRLRPNTGRLRRDRLLNCNSFWSTGWLRTATREQCRSTSKTGKPARYKTTAFPDQAAFAESWRPHSHVHAMFPCSPLGGNIW